jgi:hypothetical protein
MHVLYVAIARTAIHSRPSAEREMSAARRRNQERPATLKHHRRLAVGRRLIASAALRQSNPLNSRSSFLLLLFLHSCILSSSIPRPRSSGSPRRNYDQPPPPCPALCLSVDLRFVVVDVLFLSELDLHGYPVTRRL